VAQLGSSGQRRVKENTLAKVSGYVENAVLELGMTACVVIAERLLRRVTRRRAARDGQP
jgi:hypothetical protein